MKVELYETNKEEIYFIFKEMNSNEVKEELLTYFDKYISANSIAEKAEYVTTFLMWIYVQNQEDGKFEELYDFAERFGKIFKAVEKSDLPPSQYTLLGINLSSFFDCCRDGVEINFPSKKNALDKTAEEIAEFEKRAPEIFEKFEQVFAEYEKSNGNNL